MPGSVRGAHKLCGRAEEGAEMPLHHNKSLDISPFCIPPFYFRPPPLLDARASFSRSGMRWQHVLSVCET